MATAQPIVPSGALAAPPARPVESRDPATGEVWRRYTPATREEVRTAVEAARRAQPAWAARQIGRAHV